MAIASVNTFCFFCTLFILLYRFISKISIRSTNSRQGSVEMLKLCQFINLPPLICLAWVIQIVTRSRIILSFRNPRQPNWLFKNTGPNFFFTVILSEQLHIFFLCVVEHFFTSGPALQYICKCNWLLALHCNLSGDINWKMECLKGCTQIWFTFLHKISPFTECLSDNIRILLSQGSMF